MAVGVILLRCRQRCTILAEHRSGISGHRVANREKMMFCVDRGVRGLRSSNKEQVGDSIKEFDGGKGEGRRDRRETVCSVGSPFHVSGRRAGSFSSEFTETLCLRVGRKEDSLSMSGRGKKHAGVGVDWIR